jgi:GTPase SAR1 family protein
LEQKTIKAQIWDTAGQERCGLCSLRCWFCLRCCYVFLLLPGSVEEVVLLNPKLRSISGYDL